jgi:hypothetical protein
MSDPTGPRLDRRTLLAAISTVGAAGALTGRGAAAYLTDRETLGSNGMAAGAVTLAFDGDVATKRLAVGVALDDYGYAARDEARLCVGLGDDSNPGWVWLRACPRLPSLEDDLSARVTADGSTVFDGTLAGLLDRLSGDDGGGVLLTEFVGDGERPVTPGIDGRVCLTLAVWAPTTLADDPDAVRTLKAASPLTFTVDVYAEQSRHVPTPRRPVAGANPSFAFPPCGEPVAPPDAADLGHAISNVSLCTAAPVDPAAVSWTVRDPATGADVTGTPGEAFVVDVTAPVPIDDAVVKAGPEFRRIDAGGATRLTVTSTGGVPIEASNDFARCACAGDGVKLDDWRDADGTFTDVVSLSCGESPPGPSETTGAPADEPHDADDGRGRNAGAGSPGATR